MKGESDVLISSGSAATSSSKRTDLCVPGVLTVAGVADGDSEKVEHEDDVLPECKDASIACCREEVKRIVVAVVWDHEEVR